MSFMHEQWIPQSRAERLIASGRSVLAAASLGAVYLEPAAHPQLTAWLAGLYTLYALGFLVWTLFGPAGLELRVSIATHALDLAIFGAINYLSTGGTTSPFFVYFVFSIVCAMLRFGRRGTMITAGAAFVVFVVSSLAHIESGELNRFLIRAVYLVVAASLLVYMADYLQRIQADLARIARWPRSLTQNHERLITEVLREPALIFDAQRVLLAYEHVATRYAFLGKRDGNDLRVESVPRNIADLLLDSSSAIFVRSGSFAAVTPTETGTLTQVRASRTIPLAVIAQYNIEDVVATSFNGDFVRGRLLLLDGRPPLLEEVNLSRIAGAVIASRLDHYHASEQLQRGAVAEERVRVARDLHDSVLQALTGIALQLRTIPRVMVRDRAEAEVRLGEIEQVIVRAQKDLRWFIEQLHPERRRDDDESAAIVERIGSMSQRFEQQWGLKVENDVAAGIHQLPIAMRHEVYTLVSEAVANAAKHASARSVHVTADVDDGEVWIDVADDGKGFPFRGRYGVTELTKMKQGPATLKERVTSLGGSLIVDSTDRGSRIEIRLPLPEGA
ncbi:MAG TPA: sensor histidine kinase [Thermoanaerobaculia bacterium]|nr:sensor histidine kinase [Thermoanaerobaculia bacterium]